MNSTLGSPRGTINKTARMAGFFYLIYLVTTIPSDLCRDSFIVLGDTAATAKNIMASEWLFRLSFVGDPISAVFFLLAAWALYVLLKPVNKGLALLFLLLNLGGVAVYSINLLNQFAAVLLLSGADYLNVFQSDQLQALAMLSLYIYKYGFSGIAQIFFGAWLFPLGYLVFKSGFLPRFLGVILMVHCVVWLMSALQFFLFPGFIEITFVGITYLSYPIGFISEFGLSLWLLIMGAKEQK